MFPLNLFFNKVKSEQGILSLPSKFTELKLGMLKRGPISVIRLFLKLRPPSSRNSSSGVILEILLSPRSRNRKLGKKLMFSRSLISALAQDSVESSADEFIFCC